MKSEIDPRILRAGAIAVERDLSIFTGPELMVRYASTDSQMLFSNITGKPVVDVAQAHNPFWHYALQTWYKPPRYRKLLYAPRHRDEVADAVVKMATGQLDKYDGVIHQYPRRALKSFFMKMAVDWLAKRHKIADDLDVLILYSHNLERRANAALTSVKNMNRYNAYIAEHFGDGCLTVSGKNASFVIPNSEWGEKGQWDWPCRDPQFHADERSVTGEAALSRKAGAGYNYRMLDDWEAEDSRKSEAVRDELHDRYDQQRQLNAPPFGREWVGGTPYHIQSLYKAMLEQKHEDGTPRYWVIKTPALSDDNQPNFPTIPRLSVASLAKERANEIRRRGTDRFWYMQYQLDPSLTGEQAMQWEWFQPLTPTEYAERFGKLPKFRSVYCDPAWKGDDNHQRGSDAAIGCIDSFSIAGQVDNVLLDLAVSSDWESDEGADEMLRQMRIWHTPYYVIEQTADKPMVGLMKRVWRSTPYAARTPQMPRFVDIKGWSKRNKNERISTVAAQAKTGHWYYLTSINKDALEVLKTTVNEYPACKKRDTVDMMANANADEVLSRWVPIAIPEEAPQEERSPVQFVTRYTGLTAVQVH